VRKATLPIEPCILWVHTLATPKTLTPDSIGAKITKLRKELAVHGQLHHFDTEEWKTIMGANRRFVGEKHVQKAKAILPGHMCSIADVCETDGRSVMTRLLVIAALCFAAFLRVTEATSLLIGDVCIDAEKMVLHFPQRKTDPFRRGTTVWIARVGGRLCPVGLMERYLARIFGSRKPAELLGNLPVFPGQAKAKEFVDSVGHAAAEPWISYETVRKQMKEAFGKAGLDTKVFRTHSFRSGGATTAKLQGLPHEEIAKHGAWNDLFTFHGYLEPSEEERLRVSLEVGNAVSRSLGGGVGEGGRGDPSPTVASWGERLALYSLSLAPPSPGTH
jgi:integrase